MSDGDRVCITMIALKMYEERAIKLPLSEDDPKGIRNGVWRSCWSLAERLHRVTSPEQEAGGRYDVIEQAPTRR